MQGYERDNYRKHLTEKLLTESEGKKLTVHFHNEKNRWAILDEDKTVYGLFNSPEEIVEQVQTGVINNGDELGKILSYRKKVGKSTSAKDRLFYMDTLYGKEGHKLRESLAASGQLPGSEMTFDEVMNMLDDGSELPGAMDPNSDLAQGKNVKPLTEMCEEEIREMCEGCYESMMMEMKKLVSACQYESVERKVYHEMYENMWENRKKTLEMVMGKLAEMAGPVTPAGGSAQAGGGEVPADPAISKP